jgi:hypothetical protein
LLNCQDCPLSLFFIVPSFINQNHYHSSYSTVQDPYLIPFTPAISAVSGHSNARRKQVVVSEGKRSTSSGPQAAASPSTKHTGSTLASLTRLASLWTGLSSLSLLSHHHTHSSSPGLSLPVSVCPCLQAANSSFFCCSGSNPLHRIAAQDRRTSSLQARLLPPSTAASLLPPACQPACLPRTQDRERHDSIPLASLSLPGSDFVSRAHQHPAPEH